MARNQSNTPRRPKSLARRIVTGLLKAIGITVGGVVLLVVVLMVTYSATMPLPTHLVNDSAHVLPPEATMRLELMLQAYRQQYAQTVHVATNRNYFELQARVAAEEIGTNWREDGVITDHLVYLAANDRAAVAGAGALPESVARFGQEYRQWAEALAQGGIAARSAMPQRAAQLLAPLLNDRLALLSSAKPNAESVRGALWTADSTLALLAQEPMLLLAEAGELELALAAGALSIIAHSPDTARSAQGLPAFGSRDGGAGGSLRAAGGGGYTWVWVTAAMAFLLAGAGLALWRRRKRAGQGMAPASTPPPSQGAVGERPTIAAAAAPASRERVDALPETPRAAPAASTVETPPAVEPPAPPASTPAPEDAAQTAPRATARKEAKGCLRLLLGALLFAAVVTYVQSLPKSVDQAMAPDGESYLLPPPVNFVNDSGHLLDGAAEARLEKLLRDYEYYTSAELFVVTAPRSDGYDANAFTTILGNQWQVGKAGKDNGMILYVCGSQMPAWDEPDSVQRPHGYYGEGYLSVGQGLEPYITDAQAMRLVRQELGPAVVAHRYEEGIKACAEALIARTEALRNEHMQSSEYAKRRVKEEPMTTESLRQGILWWLADTLLMLLAAIVGVSPIIGVCFFFRSNREERFTKFYLRWVGRVALLLFAFSFRGAASRTASKLTTGAAKATGGVLGGAGGGARL